MEGGMMKTDFAERTAATTVRTTRRQLLIAAPLAALGYAAPVIAAQASEGGGVSRNSESIHQEPQFAADRKRVYAALTDAKQFDRIIQLSGVMKSVDFKVATDLSTIEGGFFALFGGYITGRQIVLQPNELIVQAWRAASWGPGLYSIARFQFVDSASGAKIIFDHAGFPNGQAKSLAAGWQANYWTPLRKLLSS
jgi:activator of HSP90 ATPase